MRIIAPAALAALLATATACASGQAATSAGATATATTTAAGASANPAAAGTGYPGAGRLAADLLAVTDMPAGWTATSVGGGSGAGLSSCPALDGEHRHLPARATAAFQKSALGPFVGEELGAGTASMEDAAWSRFASVTTTCHTFTSPGPRGAAFSWTLGDLPFPGYGDATHAITVTAVTGRITISGDIVAVRKGQVLVEVTALGVGGVDVNLVEAMVAKAVDKIDG